MSFVREMIDVLNVVHLCAELIKREHIQPITKVKLIAYSIKYVASDTF